MESKDIFIVYVERESRSALVAFESGRKAVEFFQKHGGVIIQRVDVKNMNDTKAEIEALEELEI